MTTLAANLPRAYEQGGFQDYPVIASDIIYEGAAVGLVDATGLARPLTSVDRFVGFAYAKADNSSGAASAINVRTVYKGKVQLAITDALITDVGQPVYATDESAFVLTPVGGQFVGRITRFVSAGYGIVEFGPGVVDPWYHKTVREALTGVKTFAAIDCGKLFGVTAAGDGDALTLCAIADGLSGLTILATGSFGTTAVTIHPVSGDMILAADISGSDHASLVCTKATQRRGDFVTLISGDPDGYMATEMRGIWAAV